MRNPPNLNLKAKDTTICTSLFLFKKGRVLYGMRNYKKVQFKDLSVWTTPGGRCDEGETIEGNLRRELFEETGINRAIIHTFLGTCPGAKEGDTLYVYTGSTEQEARLCEPEKFSEWRWWGPKETPDNFINPAALKMFHQSFIG